MTFDQELTALVHKWALSGEPEQTMAASLLVNAAAQLAPLQNPELEKQALATFIQVLHEFREVVTQAMQQAAK